MVQNGQSMLCRPTNGCSTLSRTEPSHKKAQNFPGSEHSLTLRRRCRRRPIVVVGVAIAIAAANSRVSGSEDLNISFLKSVGTVSANAYSHQPLQLDIHHATQTLVCAFT